MSETTYNKLIVNLTSDTHVVASGDLITAPNSDGSDFALAVIIEGFRGLVLLNFNIWCKAVSSCNPKLRLYRYCSVQNKWFKGSLFQLDAAVTNTTTGDYIATENYEVSADKIAIVLEDAEIGSSLKITANRTSKQGI